MTAAVARFAQSDAGRLYAAVCERYHVDPAPPEMPDLLAFQLRTALAVVSGREEREKADDHAARAGDPLARARQMDRWVKAQEKASTNGG